MKAQQLKWSTLGVCGVLGAVLASGCPSSSQSGTEGGSAQTRTGGGTSTGGSGAGAGVSAASNPGATAPSYTSEADKFALWLPGKPKEGSQQIDIPGVGKTDVRILSLSTPEAVYVVVPTLVPPGISLSSPEPFLDGVQTGFLSSSKGTLVSSKSLKLGEYPGREIVVSSGASQMRGRILLSAKHSYQVMAILPPGKPVDSAAVTKVLDSFQILAQ